MGHLSEELQRERSLDELSEQQHQLTSTQKRDTLQKLSKQQMADPSSSSFSSPSSPSLSQQLHDPFVNSAKCQHDTFMETQRKDRDRKVLKMMAELEDSKIKIQQRKIRNTEREQQLYCALKRDNLQMILADMQMTDKVVGIHA
jgi:hypothetical protein